MSGGGSALFGGGGSGSGSGGRGGLGSGGKSALCEFRAGKMNLSGPTVTADKRKGMIQIDQGEDDQLMHFRWKERSASGRLVDEDDLIIFPDDVEFKAVPQCTTGRVFLLKFKSSSRKMFFWMQEPKADKDDDYCKKVNDLLNNPPAPGSRSSGGGGGGGSGGLSGLDLNSLGDGELQSLLSGMDQQQLMQLFGGSGAGALSNLASLLSGGSGGGGGSGSRQRSSGASRSSRESSARTPATASTPAATTPSAASTTTAAAASATTPAATPATSGATKSSSSAAAASATPTQPIQLADLQNILSGIGVPSSQSGGASSGPAVDLASGVTVDAVQPLLRNPDFVKRMKELLPAEHRNNDVADEIKGTVQSPQFQQALGLFSSAFQSAQLAPLIREFDLGDEAVAAANTGDLEAFAKALQKEKKDKEGEDKKKKDDEPEEMALD